MEFKLLTCFYENGIAYLILIKIFLLLKLRDDVHCIAM